jgi:hypothetical protein
LIEFKAGDNVNERLRTHFPAIKYRLFRQLGSAPILVLDNAQQPLDGFEYNLFAAKPDRASTLSQQGLLIDAIPAWAPSTQISRMLNRFGGIRSLRRWSICLAGAARQRIPITAAALRHMSHGEMWISRSRRVVRLLHSHCRV